MKQENFLAKFAEEVLTKKFGELTEEQKQMFVPEMTELIEERVGIILLPKLSQENAAEFADLLDKETGPEEWKNFWYNALPNFEEEMKSILSAFVLEISEK